MTTPNAIDHFLADIGDARTRMQTELTQIALAQGLDVTENDELHRKRVAIYNRVQQLCREWTSPHQFPTSAGNFELLAMNVARLAHGVDSLIAQHGLGCPWGDLLDALSESDPQVARVYASAFAWWELIHEDFRLSIGAFLGDWFLRGFPRLELSHKYAAALCCTDCPPELDVRSPWPAWSLVLPPDLLGDDQTLARVWVHAVGAERPRWVLNVWRGGDVQCVVDSDATAITAIMVENMIRGACLSITDPEVHRKQGSKAPARGKGNKRQGPPDLTQARFMLAPPVTVDLRQHVAEAITGRHTGAPKVQFLVRGHWRDQAHGHARTLRKTIWIQPFWKGPESGRVLLRTHKVIADDPAV
jgi:hypothetical protein